ncbi:MAG: alpha/beta fold hydrolase [Archaeoglobaceae archaeon]|nr:alpha/beta fold hydrolase [Archaeoglobaceae archaeon]MCX8152290.1 alpha/beta fold hydrolase [Archaeoglobaceae archaeon]MDW8013968.1 alpha/beta fold hydrolase [Archaeoglobaceae archaeon]
MLVEKIKDLKPGFCEKEVVLEDWLFKLHRFKAEVKQKTPILISYAFINRPYILDLHREVSAIKYLVEAGFDVWLIDWGYPKIADRHLSIEDYVDFIDRCVEVVRRSPNEKITLWGYCLGTTLAVIYASLYPEKIRNLIIQTPPVNFDTDNTLALWAKNIDPLKVSRALLNATGDFLNIAFLLIDPVRLVIGKYQSLIDNLNDEKSVKDFFYMDHWIFDSPSVPGKVFEEYIIRWYHRNEIMKGEFTVKGKKVDIKNITMPLLVLVASKDHITPPESAIPFFEAVPSKDKKILMSEKGHIGLTVSRSSHTKIWPEVVKWLIERSN